MKYQLLEKPFIEIKENDAIIVFPSRPYWFSATKEIKLILSLCENVISDVDLVKQVSSKIGVDEAESQETVSDVVGLLFENGVFLIDGKLHEGIEEIEPYFQVNEVENVLTIATTNACNLKCPQCYANARTKLSDEMTTEEIKKIIDDLHSMPWKNDVSCVGLTGGEYFLRKDGLELVKYIHDLGFY